MVAAAVGAAAVAGSIYGANKQGDAISDAARTQANSTNASIDFQRYALDQQRADLSPFVGLAFDMPTGDANGPNTIFKPGTQSGQNGVSNRNPNYSFKGAANKLAPAQYSSMGASTTGTPNNQSLSQNISTLANGGIKDLLKSPGSFAAPTSQIGKPTATGSQATPMYRMTPNAPITLLKEMAVNKENYAYDPSKDALLNNALNRTTRAVMDAQAATGKLGSGSTLTSLIESMSPIYMNRQQQMFDQAYNTNNQQFNQLQNIVGMAQNAAAGQGTATANTANNITNLMTNNANAQAASGIAQANNQANMLNNLMGAGMMAYGMYNKGAK